MHLSPLVPTCPICCVARWNPAAALCPRQSTMTRFPWSAPNLPRSNGLLPPTFKNDGRRPTRSRPRHSASERRQPRQKLLGDLALERLVDLMIREADPLVLTTILDALSFDDREPATRLACAALSHPASEVRRLACEHLGMHPNPRYASLLAKSLTDPNSTVVTAAVRAIGRLPSLDDPRSLEKMLAADNHALHVEAAESLARFGFPSGVAALERLGSTPRRKSGDLPPSQWATLPTARSFPC